VPMWFERSSCGLPVVLRWYECPLCGLPVVFSLISCGLWLRSAPVVQRVVLCGVCYNRLARRAGVVLCWCGRHMRSVLERRLPEAQQGAVADAAARRQDQGFFGSWFLPDHFPDLLVRRS
jgi:hypothetical protein